MHNLTASFASQSKRHWVANPAQDLFDEQAPVFRLGANPVFVGASTCIIARFPISISDLSDDFTRSIAGLRDGDGLWGWRRNGRGSLFHRCFHTLRLAVFH
jgi:hypothetical protein